MFKGAGLRSFMLPSHKSQSSSLNILRPSVVKSELSKLSTFLALNVPCCVCPDVIGAVLRMSSFEALSKIYGAEHPWASSSDYKATLVFIPITHFSVVMCMRRLLSHRRPLTCHLFGSTLCGNFSSGLSTVC